MTVYFSTYYEEKLQVKVGTFKHGIAIFPSGERTLPDNSVAEHFPGDFIMSQVREVSDVLCTH